MPLPMMHVRVMRMCVDQRLVHVHVGVRLASVPCEIMAVPVMRIVIVRMQVLLILMSVQVHVSLGEMQPHTYRHQHAGADELPSHGIAT